MIIIRYLLSLVTINIVNPSYKSTKIFLLGSGIYVMIPGKTNDTIYLDVGNGTTEDVGLPTPFIETALFGDE